jgi:hypothetical protein
MALDAAWHSAKIHDLPLEVFQLAFFAAKALHGPIAASHEQNRKACTKKRSWGGVNAGAVSLVAVIQKTSREIYACRNGGSEYRENCEDPSGHFLFPYLSRRASFT